MEIIKIKRATTQGLEDCEGIFFEYEGFQFCLTKVDKTYYTIELSTGGSVCDFYSDRMRKNTALNIAKQSIFNRSAKEIKDTANAFKNNFRREFKFPVNQPIIKTT